MSSRTHLMKRYYFILIILSALLCLGLGACGAKSKSTGSATTSTDDTSKNDLVSGRTCSGNPTPGTTLFRKWSFKQKMNGGFYQMDLEIASGHTNISVTCKVGNQTKILSDSVPSNVANNQLMILDSRTQSEPIGSKNCELSVPKQNWSYTLAGNCLTLANGKQNRTWVRAN